MTILTIPIQVKKASSTSWNAVNPVLKLGEPGLETDSGNLKFGDGVSTWSALGYFTGLGFTAASSGANSNITSLSGLTTALSVAQGGTGGKTFPIHGVLLGQGTGTFTEASVGTAGRVLTDNGASLDPTFQTIPSQVGRLINVQVFTSSGTFTPTVGATSWIVEACGGGGGGASVGTPPSGYVAACAPGMPGSVAKARYTGLTGSYVVTIGAGGIATTTLVAATTYPGTTGGTTSLGSLLICPGGPGGNSTLSNAPQGASATNATVQAAVTGSGILTSRSGQGKPFTFVSSSVTFGGVYALPGPLSDSGAGAGGDGGAANPGNTSTGTNGAAGIILIYEYA